MLFSPSPRLIVSGARRPGAADIICNIICNACRSAKLRGQVLYAPVYSPRSADRQSTLLTSYLDGSRNLGPLASTHMVIEQKNVSGARG